jgi:peroxiredoxin Q/BCP
MRACFVLAASAGLAVTAFAHLRAGSEDLKPGDPAPPFSLTGSDGQTYRLADFLGKQAVVLAWFPKAFTGG